MKIIRSNPLQKGVISGGGQNFQPPADWMTASYGSGWPIMPVQAPKDVELPREIDYPIMVNFSLNPRSGYRGLMDFASLKEVYENVTEVKIPVNLIWRELTAFVPQLVDSDENKIDDHPYIWTTISPDRLTPFSVWLTRFLKSTKVYDAAAINLQTDAHDNVVGMHYIDGSTLLVIVDKQGRIPQALPMADYVMSLPENERRVYLQTLRAYQEKYHILPTVVPAFTQVIQGTPFAWWSSDQIWYQPQSPRLDAPYGESFIEQCFADIMLTVNIKAFELGHYKTGNMPEGFVTLPKDFYGTQDRVTAGELIYNARMSSNPATERMRLRMFPDGTKYFPTKKPDFPQTLYTQAWKNILHTIGIPPAEFGDIPGSGLGGKGFKEGSATDLGRNTLNPHKTFVEDVFNHILKRDGVDDVTWKLAYPQEEIDPDKFKTSLYDGMAHGTYTLNDVLGQLGLDPVPGSMREGKDDAGNDLKEQDPHHIANKHLIVAGASIYVLEDMQTQGGMAIPAGQAPNQPGGLPINEESAVNPDNKPVDSKGLAAAIQNIIAGGKPDSKTISIPGKTTETATAQKLEAADGFVGYNLTGGQSVPAGIDPEQYAIGCAEEAKEHPEVDQAIIPQLVIDHLKEKPDYYKLSKVDLTHSDGCMVAVFMPSEVAGALRGIAAGLGLPDDAELETADQMHVTLAFLPDGDQVKANREKVLSAMQSACLDQPELHGNIQGYGVFNGKDGKHVLYATLDIYELPFIRTAICNKLDEMGVLYAKDHGFVPHITLAYFPDAWQLPEGFMVPDIDTTITGVTLAIGPELLTVPLTIGQDVAPRAGKAEYSGDLQKHCGVCPEDDAYFGAPISRELPFSFPGGPHANAVEVVAMCPPGLPPKPALWKPEGGELEVLQERVGGPMYPREEAAYLLDRALGFMLVPVAYVCEANDEKGAVVFYSLGNSAGRDVETYAPQWVERAGVLDYIQSQTDRNTTNWLTHPDDYERMLLIDNGLGFPSADNIETSSPFARAMIGKPLSPESLTAIKRLLGDAATWHDITALIGDQASAKAYECAREILESEMITAQEMGTPTESESESAK